MATSLSGTVQLLANLIYDGGSELSELSDELLSSNMPSWTIANGTGADQADLMWYDQRTLAASTSEDLDLSGSLVNSFGATMTFARIKAIIVYAASDNGALIQVGGAASNQFINWVANSSDVVNVRADGFFVLAAPDATAYAVTAGTGDLLKINNTDGGDTATYDIYIIGASA